MDPIQRLQSAADAATETLHERKTALDEAELAVREAPEDIGEEALQERETAFDAACESFDEADAELKRCRTNLADAERRERIVNDNPLPVETRVRVGREESVYRADSQERSFFRDAYEMQFHHNPEARERLERHGREFSEAGIQTRATATAGFSGLVVPQYLVDLFAPYAKAGSPLLNAVRKLPLPAEGMTVNISRLTTPTSVAAQSAENQALANQDPDDTLLTVNVRSYGGYVDVSRQAIERGAMIDTAIFADLIGSYYTSLDDGIINGDGTSGTHLGILHTSNINSVSYSDGSPTLPELYPHVAHAIGDIGNTLFRPATTMLMTPLRWAWMTSVLSAGDSRPLIVPDAQGPWNAMAVGDAPQYGGVAGSMLALPVITDGNIPTNLGGSTNQDAIIVVRMPELLFWQDGDGAPREFRFEQVNGPQSIRLAVFGYSAFTAGRYPEAVATVTGSGLTDPSTLF